LEIGTSKTGITTKAKDEWSIYLQWEAMPDVPLRDIKLLG